MRSGGADALTPEQQAVMDKMPARFAALIRDLFSRDFAAFFTFSDCSLRGRSQSRYSSSCGANSTL